jgi:uncharacterized damage-inducible protein DinB
MKRSWGAASKKPLDFRYFFAYDCSSEVTGLMKSRVQEYADTEETMSLSEALLPEFDQEMGHTRKTLERVPEGKPDWKPHEKSMPMGYLSVHIALLPSWGKEVITKDSLDVAPPGAPPFQMPTAKSRIELLEMFDKSAAEGRAAIADASDEHLRKPWTLLAGGKTIFTMPRIMVLRGMVMNHIIHHRAQLGVYLRLNDVPVPAIYGPSADEGGM